MDNDILLCYELMCVSFAACALAASTIDTKGELSQKEGMKSFDNGCVLVARFPPINAVLQEIFC